MDEPTLLERIVAGDVAAVSEFINRYGGLVLSISRRFTETESDAEDAVQEIFLDLWKSAKSFRPDVASEKTFTTMIARRRLIDRRRRRNVATDATFQLDRIPTELVTATDAAELAEEAEIAVQCLNELPSDQSRAIRLSVYDGLSHSQIAKVTGKSLGTVKTQIRRGIIKIREKIGFCAVANSEGGAL